LIGCLKIYGITAAPGSCVRAGMIARRQPQTPIWQLHQWGRCIATMRCLKDASGLRSPVRACQTRVIHAIKGCVLESRLDYTFQRDDRDDRNIRVENKSRFDWWTTATDGA
jgi:hypothetical protein